MINKKYNCKRCFDSGVYAYMNSPDDFDWTDCDCDAAKAISDDKQYKNAQELYTQRNPY